MIVAAIENNIDTLENIASELRAVLEALADSQNLSFRQGLCLAALCLERRPGCAARRHARTTLGDVGRKIRERVGFSSSWFSASRSVSICPAFICSPRDAHAR